MAQIKRALRPVRPPAGLESQYRKKLKGFVSEMEQSLLYWLTARYKVVEKDIIVQDGALGDLQKRLRELKKQWKNRSKEFAEMTAEWFASNALRYTSQNLAAQFKKTGLNKVGFDLDWKYTSRRERAIFKSLIQQNVNLIENIEDRFFTNVEGIVLRGIESGKDLGYMTEQLHKEYGVTERRAAMIARDQTNKACNNLTRQRLLDYGITKGQWLHTASGKTYRDSHVQMDGTVYDIEQGCFDDDYGDWVQPGELVNCYCVCIPLVTLGPDDDVLAEWEK